MFTTPLVIASTILPATIFTPLLPHQVHNTPSAYTFNNLDAEAAHKKIEKIDQ